MRALWRSKVNRQAQRMTNEERAAMRAEIQASGDGGVPAEHVWHSLRAVVTLSSFSMCRRPMTVHPRTPWQTRGEWTLALSYEASMAELTRCGYGCDEPSQTEQIAPVRYYRRHTCHLLLYCDPELATLLLATSSQAERGA